MAIKTASTYAEIVKFEEQEDGTVIAYGKATDATLDSDEQICDPVWLKQAMPEWFKYGNIREQHSSIAAGVATEYEEKDGGHYITAHIVDPSSAKKVKTGVLKGFSIGIRRPRVIKDNKAAGGRIVDGEIVEVSIVDRPANPSCTLVVAKAVGGVMTQVEEYTEKGSPDQPRDDHGRFASNDDGSMEATVRSETAENDLKELHEYAESNFGELHMAADQAAEFVNYQDDNDPHAEPLGQISSIIDRAENKWADAQISDAATAEFTLNSAISDISQAIALAINGAKSSDGELKNAFESLRDGLADQNSTLRELRDIYGSGDVKSIRTNIAKGSPDQPRDERGRFASTSTADSENALNEIAAADAAAAERLLNEVLAEDSGSGGSVQAADEADTHLSGLEEEFDKIMRQAESRYTESQWENITSAKQYLEEARSAIDSALDPETFDLSDSIDGALAAMYEAESNIGTVARSHADEDRWANIQDMARDVISALEPHSEVAHLKFISTRVNKYAATDIKKFDQGSFDTARRALATLIQVEAGEMADGHDETYSLSCLLQAVHSLMCWYEGEEAEGETVEMPEGIEMSDKPATVKAEDGVCETCGEKECKCSSKADEVEDSACKECGEKECKCAEGGYRATEKSANTEDDLRATITDIVKSLLPTEVGEVDATKAAESERIEVLEAELARVKSLAAPNGPRRFGAVSSTSKEQLNKAKARQLRAKAEMTLDKALADGYRQMARDLETNSETE